MGYETHFIIRLRRISTIDPRRYPDKIFQQDVEDIKKYLENRMWDVSCVYYEDIATHSIEGWGKWYGNEQDLTDLSNKYPNIGFLAYGEGEDRDDEWYTLFACGVIVNSWGMRKSFFDRNGREMPDDI